MTEKECGSNYPPLAWKDRSGRTAEAPGRVRPSYQWRCRNNRNGRLVRRNARSSPRRRKPHRHCARCWLPERVPANRKETVETPVCHRDFQQPPHAKRVGAAHDMDARTSISLGIIPLHPFVQRRITELSCHVRAVVFQHWRPAPTWLPCVTADIAVAFRRRRRPSRGWPCVPLRLSRPPRLSLSYQKSSMESSICAGSSSLPMRRARSAVTGRLPANPPSTSCHAVILRSPRRQQR